MTPSEKMPPTEKEKFLIEQTCVLLAARIAAAPKDVDLNNLIKRNFREIYETLANEVKQPYIATSVK